jgi:hypothetical protein
MPGEVSSEAFELDFEQACEGCPAAYDGLAITDETKKCPFYKTYINHVDGGSVEVEHHNCHNTDMLGKYAGAGILVTREVDPFTGESRVGDE